jgi:hypothetical protein
MTFAGACASRRWRGCLPALVLAADCGGEPPTRVDATVTVLQGAGRFGCSSARSPKAPAWPSRCPDLGLAIEPAFEVRPGAAADLAVPAPDVAVALGFVGTLDAAASS